MSLGTWQPTTQDATLSRSQLSDLLAKAVPSLNRLEDLGEGPWDSLQKFQALPPEQWTAFSQELKDSELVFLIKALTLLEQQPGWDRGKNSPVIPLFKAHKQRLGQIDHELAQWVKSHTDNHFLPFGSLL